VLGLTSRFRDVYGEGKSEAIIGRLIKETDEETKSKLYIATKCA
jgi:aryl-alcohol dehydrogenase-like predicted oxidoreductase